MGLDMDDTTGAHPDDHRLAADLAGRAGALLLELRAGGLVGRALGDEGDRRAHRLLADAIAEARPDDGLLSEEGDHDTDRTSRRRAWIVDPLDGTREYGEPPRTDWAVHVALAVDGRAVVGAVALPGRGVVLSTSAPPPAPPAPPSRPRLVVSRSRAPEWVAPLAERLGADIVELGSAGAKTMAVVLGEADIYAHGGGMYEWDSAAPVAVAAAAGLHVSRLDGSPLVYNRPDPWLPDLLVCPPGLAGPVLDACHDLGATA